MPATTLRAGRGRAAPRSASAPAAARTSKRLHAFLHGIGAHIVHGPQDDRYAPGYYSILFEDPDGIRLEINHVPGRGLLAEGGAAHGGGSRSTPRTG